MNKLILYQISIILVLYVGYAFYYFTRKSISFMLPHFGANSSASLNLTKNDIGIIISSQNLAYTISKLFFGFLSDLVSCRILFGAGLFISGLLNIGFKKDSQPFHLYYLSFLIGLAQGPAWSACAKILQNWVPKSQLATWWSIVSTASNVAGALGPLVATWIALKYHWSFGFMIPGCICMSVGYLAIIVLRNKPSDVGLADFYGDESEIIEYDEDNEDTEEEELNEDSLSRFKQIKIMVQYPFFLSICLVYFLVQLVKTLFSDWSQIYLTKIIRVDFYTASLFVSSMEISGIVGSVLSGIFSDLALYFLNRKKLDNNKFKPIKIRMFLILVYLILLSVVMHFFNFFVKKNVKQSMLLGVGSSLGYLLYGSISMLGVMAMEFTPSQFSGTSHSIAAFCANLGAVFAGLPFSLLSKMYSWNAAFKFAQYFTISVLIVAALFSQTKSSFDPLITKAKKIRKDK